MQGSEYANDDVHHRLRHHRPQNHNLSVDLREKKATAAADERPAPGDPGGRDSQVSSSQDQKLATTLREGSRAEAVPSHKGAKVSGGAPNTNAPHLKSDLAIPQIPKDEIAVVTDENAQSLAISSSGPPYAEDHLAKVYETTRREESKLQRFSERRSTQSPMIDDIVHQALQEERMRPVTKMSKMKEEEQRRILDLHRQAAAKLQQLPKGDPEAAQPQEMAAAKNARKEDLFDADTNYNNRVLIFSRNQTITMSSHRSGEGMSARQGVEPRTTLGPPEQPYAAARQRSNVPIQLYQRHQETAEYSESLDVSASMRIAPQQRSNLAPMLASARMREARLSDKRLLRRRTKANEDLNVRDDEILFET